MAKLSRNTGHAQVIVINSCPFATEGSEYSGDLKSGLVWISKWQKEVGFSNGPDF